MISGVKPTFGVSIRGRLTLLHDGFKFVQRGQPRVTDCGTTASWRCSHLINGRFGCNAKAQTFIDFNGVENVTFSGSHCHEANR